MIMIDPVDNFPEDDISLVSSPLTLPNGVVIPNRLAKVSSELLMSVIGSCGLARYLGRS